MAKERTKKKQGTLAPIREVNKHWLRHKELRKPNNNPSTRGKQIDIMPKSKKYRKKPRGYKRKLANAPHLYNRQEPPRFGDAYNRSNAGDPSINAFHIGNRRYQDREKLESLKRLKNRLIRFLFLKVEFLLQVLQAQVKN